MCLSYLDEKKRGKNYGYKVFRKTETGLGSEFFYDNKAKEYPIGKWIDERDYRPEGERYKEELFATNSTYEGGIAYKDGSYPVGFHCFYTLREAKAWLDDEPSFDKGKLIIRKVGTKRIVASGRQLHGTGYYHIFVAKKIKILGGRGGD